VSNKISALYGSILQPTACVALIRKAADGTGVMIFKSFGMKETNDLVVTSNKLTNNFVSLVTSCLSPDVARGPPV
jgi:hypothetical protein